MNVYYVPGTGICPGDAKIDCGLWDNQLEWEIQDERVVSFWRW